MVEAEHAAEIIAEQVQTAYKMNHSLAVKGNLEVEYRKAVARPMELRIRLASIRAELKVKFGVQFQEQTPDTPAVPEPSIQGTSRVIPYERIEEVYAEKLAERARQPVQSIFKQLYPTLYGLATRPGRAPSNAAEDAAAQRTGTSLDKIQTPWAVGVVLALGWMEATYGPEAVLAIVTLGLVTGAAYLAWVLWSAVRDYQMPALDAPQDAGRRMFTKVFAGAAVGVAVFGLTKEAQAETTTVFNADGTVTETAVQDRGNGSKLIVLETFIPAAANSPKVLLRREEMDVIHATGRAEIRNAYKLEEWDKTGRVKLTEYSLTRKAGVDRRGDNHGLIQGQAITSQMAQALGQAQGEREGYLIRLTASDTGELIGVYRNGSDETFYRAFAVSGARALDLAVDSSGKMVFRSDDAFAAALDRVNRESSPTKITDAALTAGEIRITAQDETNRFLFSLNRRTGALNSIYRIKKMDTSVQPVGQLEALRDRTYGTVDGRPILNTQADAINRAVFERRSYIFELFRTGDELVSVSGDYRGNRIFFGVDSQGRKLTSVAVNPAGLLSEQPSERAELRFGSYGDYEISEGEGNAINGFLGGNRASIGGFFNDPKAGLLVYSVPDASGTQYFIRVKSGNIVEAYGVAQDGRLKQLADGTYGRASDEKGERYDISADDARVTGDYISAYGVKIAGLSFDSRSRVFTVSSAPNPQGSRFVVGVREGEAVTRYGLNGNQLVQFSNGDYGLINDEKGKAREIKAEAARLISEGMVSLRTQIQGLAYERGGYKIQPDGSEIPDDTLLVDELLAYSEARGGNQFFVSVLTNDKETKLRSAYGVNGLDSQKARLIRLADMHIDAYGPYGRAKGFNLLDADGEAINDWLDKNGYEFSFFGYGAPFLYAYAKGEPPNPPRLGIIKNTNDRFSNLLGGIRSEWLVGSIMAMSWLDAVSRPEAVLIFGALVLTAGLGYAAWALWNRVTEANPALRGISAESIDKSLLRQLTPADRELLARIISTHDFESLKPVPRKVYIAKAEMSKKSRDEGRTVYLRLDKPAVIGNEHISILRIKGVRLRIEADGRVKAYSGTRGHVITKIMVDEHGDLFAVPGADDPAGGMLSSSAKNEFEVMREGLRTRSFPADYPVGWGTYPGMRFEDEPLGWVIAGMTGGDKRLMPVNDVDFRENDIETGDSRIYGTEFSKKVALEFGRVLRAYHDAGFFHRFTFGNMGIISDAGADGRFDVVVRDLDMTLKRSSLKGDEGSRRRQEAGWRFIDLLGIASAIFDETPLSDEGDGIFPNILRGYFSDSGAEELRGMLRAASEPAFFRDYSALRSSANDEPDRTLALNETNPAFGGFWAALFKLTEPRHSAAPDVQAGPSAAPERPGLSLRRALAAVKAWGERLLVRRGTDASTIAKRMEHVHALVLAGGASSRFFPFNKIFADLTGSGRTMIQQTFDRATRDLQDGPYSQFVSDDHFYVATGADSAEEIKKQLKLPNSGNVLVEPGRKNTLPAILWAMAHIKRDDPDPRAVVTMLTSDHVIPDTAEVRAALDRAIQIAQAEPSIVTIGIRPDDDPKSWTGFGVIRAQDGETAYGEGVRKVGQFNEKPSEAAAAELIRNEPGKWRWTSGMYVFSISALETALEQYQPGIHATYKKMAQAVAEGKMEEARRLFNELPGKIPHAQTGEQKDDSIDYAVMVPMTLGKIKNPGVNAYVVSGDFEWTDIGSWDALRQVVKADADNNIIIGDIQVGENVRDSILVAAPGKRIAASNINGLIVVHGEDGTVACLPETRAQEMNSVASSVKSHPNDSVVLMDSPNTLAQVIGGVGRIAALGVRDVKITRQGSEVRIEGIGAGASPTPAPRPAASPPASRVRRAIEAFRPGVEKDILSLQKQSFAGRSIAAALFSIKLCVGLSVFVFVYLPAMAVSNLMGKGNFPPFKEHFRVKDDVPASAEYILTLGIGVNPDGSANALTAAVADSAADLREELHEAGVAPKILLSGGNPMNGISEGEAMRRLLESKPGLDMNEVQLTELDDHRYVTTEDHVRAVAQVFRENWPKDVVIVGHPSYLPRTLWTFRKAFPDIRFHAKNTGEVYDRASPYLRLHSRLLFDVWNMLSWAHGWLWPLTFVARAPSSLDNAPAPRPADGEVAQKSDSMARHGTEKVKSILYVFMLVWVILMTSFFTIQFIWFAEHIGRNNVGYAYLDPDRTNPRYSSKTGASLELLRSVKPEVFNYVIDNKIPVEILEHKEFIERYMKDNKGKAPHRLLPVIGAWRRGILVDDSYAKASTDQAAVIAHEIVHGQHSDSNHPSSKHRWYRHILLSEEEEARLEGYQVAEILGAKLRLIDIILGFWIRAKLLFYAGSVILYFIAYKIRYPKKSFEGRQNNEGIGGTSAPRPAAEKAITSIDEVTTQPDQPVIGKSMPAASTRFNIRSYIYISSILITTIFFTAFTASYINWKESNLLVAAANVIFMLFMHFSIMDSVVNRSLRRVKPRILPEISLPDALPEQLKTIAYYPVLFKNLNELSFFEENLIPSIEANNDGNIKWVVMSTSPEGIRELEVERIAQLQQKYGKDRILYVHRSAEIGNWEKKRGGYMHFMVWLRQSLREDGVIGPEPRFPAMPFGLVFDQVLGDVRALEGSKNFLVGDSDTIWPEGSVKKIVSKIAHPENQEYGIFQGRTEPYNASESVLTDISYHFSSKFKDLDESLWKATGQRNFIGHGAGWDIDRFLSDMAGNIKDGFLSHDTAEAIFSKTAMVSDVTTYESIPSNLFLFFKQIERWWWGNKLTAVFLKRYVPDEIGRRVRNPAKITDKYIVFLTLVKGYFSALMLVLMLYTNMIFSPFILYESLSSMFVIYALFIGYHLYGSPLLGDSDLRHSFKSIKGLGIFVMLGPVIIVETSMFMIKSFVNDLTSKAMSQPKSAQWNPQSGLSKDLSLLQSIMGMKTSMILGILTLLFFNQYMGPGLYMFFTSLVLSPLAVWLTSLQPRGSSAPRPAAGETVFQPAKHASAARTFWNQFQRDPFYRVLVILITLDQFTKLLAHYFASTGPITVIPGWIHIVSLLHVDLDPSSKSTLLQNFIFLSTMVFTIFFHRRYMGKTTIFPRFRNIIGAIGLAGILTNILDRIVFGGVVDWLGIAPIRLAMNIADIYLLALWPLVISFAVMMVEIFKHAASITISEDQSWKITRPAAGETALLAANLERVAQMRTELKKWLVWALEFAEKYVAEHPGEDLEKIRREIKDEIYAPLFKAMDGIETLVHEGKIRPDQVDLKLFSADEKEGKVGFSGRDARVGQYAMKGDPWQVGHFFVMLEAMAQKGLDKVYYTLDNTDKKRKDSLTSLALREAITLELAPVFSPFLEYSPLMKNDKDFPGDDGESVFFRPIKLNRGLNVHWFYMAGSDHRHWITKKGLPDTAKKLMDNMKKHLDGYSGEKVSIIFSERKGEPLRRVWMWFLSWRSGISVLKIIQPMDVSATRVREKGHWWTSPPAVYAMASAYGLKRRGFDVQDSIGDEINQKDRSLVDRIDSEPVPELILALEDERRQLFAAARSVVFNIMDTVKRAVSKDAVNPDHVPAEFRAAAKGDADEVRRLLNLFPSLGDKDVRKPWLAKALHTEEARRAATQIVGNAAGTEEETLAAALEKVNDHYARLEAAVETIRKSGGVSLGPAGRLFEHLKALGHRSRREGGPPKTARQNGPSGNGQFRGALAQQRRPPISELDGSERSARAPLLDRGPSGRAGAGQRTHG